MLPFARQLAHLGYTDLKAETVSTLQVNLGWRCNQACKHCHLMAGPQRPEQMQRQTIDAIIRVVERWAIPCVDLTGGAPELNPHYEYLVERLDRLGTHIITRCNLTILPHLTFPIGFSCKEACFKALGVSWTNSRISWKDIEIFFSNENDLQEYSICLNGYALELFNERKCSKIESYLEYTDDYVIFQIILLS